MTVRITRKMIVAAAILATVFAASAAFGAIPDAGGVVHGCYELGTGKLRVTDSQTNVPKPCTSKEAALDWNQQGPKGDPGTPGAPGAKGDTGAKGEPGASDGYITTPESVIVAGGTSVASLYLPAGSYMLSAKLQAVNYFQNQSFACSLGAGFNLDTGSETTGGTGEPEYLTLMTAHTFNTSGYATLY